MLPERQKAALNEIQAYIDEFGIPPTVRDLCDIMGVKSPSTVYNYLKPLRSKGYITWWDNSPRSIRVLRKEA